MTVLHAEKVVAMTAPTSFLWAIFPGMWMMLPLKLFSVTMERFWMQKLSVIVKLASQEALDL